MLSVVHLKLLNFYSRSAPVILKADTSLAAGGSTQQKRCQTVTGKNWILPQNEYVREHNEPNFATNIVRQGVQHYCCCVHSNEATHLRSSFLIEMGALI